MLKLLGDYFLFTGALCGLMFCTAYGISAPWWRSEMGRHIMAFTASVSLTLAYASFRVIVPPVRPEFGVRALVFGVIAAMLAWRLFMLFREQIREPRKRTGDDIRRKQRDSSGSS